MQKRVSMKLMLLFLAVAFTLTLASAASAQPGEFVKGVLQPLADGFPKGPITLINVDDPGTRDGIYARTLQQALKGISPVPILVSDEPSAMGGTFYVLKDVLNREGGAEGRYPIIVSVFGAATDLLLEPITKEMGLDISDMNMVIVTETIPYAWSQRKNAPWGRTFADLVKYGKANPGKLRYISNGVGSGGDIVGEWIIQTLGLKVNKIPQDGDQEALAAIGAGEGDFTSTDASDARGDWQAGKVDIIMVTGSTVVPPWDKDPHVVCSDAAGLPKVGMTLAVGFTVPKQVPQAHVNWLYKLFKAGASTDVYKQREKTLAPIAINIMDPEQANALKMRLFKIGDPVIRSIGLHIDQKK
jgi:tripartite-type tricarboxylate transporter receptor subunit TctC